VQEFLNNLGGLGTGLSYRPARLHSLAELVPWDRFLGSKKFKNSGSGDKRDGLERARE
jgi:hypothetical protein